MTPTSKYLSCAGREIHCLEWGSGHDVVIAWHGLARTWRDMDDLAAHLAARRYRVICPDTIGRGLSQWSPEPEREYCLAFYVRPRRGAGRSARRRALPLGRHLDGRCDRHAGRGRPPARPHAQPGAQRQRAAARRGGDRAHPLLCRRPAAFDTVSELEQYFRTVYKPYGWLSDAQWRRLTETSTRRLPDGRVTPHYDPAMVMQFTHHADDYTLWDAWDALDLPVLCLRGEHSDLLLRRRPPSRCKVRGPSAVVVEIAGCGHAPALNTPEHWALVERFFVAAG